MLTLTKLFSIIKPLENSMTKMKIFLIKPIIPKVIPILEFSKLIDLIARTSKPMPKTYKMKATLLTTLIKITIL